MELMGIVETLFEGLTKLKEHDVPGPYCMVITGPSVKELEEHTDQMMFRRAMDPLRPPPVLPAPGLRFLGVFAGEVYVYVPEHQAPRRSKVS